MEKLPKKRQKIVSRRFKPKQESKYVFIISPKYTINLREGVKKKNWKKAVRLTAWVDPSPPSPEAVRKM